MLEQVHEVETLDPTRRLVDEIDPQDIIAVGRVLPSGRETQVWSREKGWVEEGVVGYARFFPTFFHHRNCIKD